jgi:hypothetical protein
MAGSAKPAGWAAPVLMLLLIFVSVMSAIRQAADSIMTKAAAQILGTRHEPCG